MLLLAAVIRAVHADGKPKLNTLERGKKRPTRPTTDSKGQQNGSQTADCGQADSRDTIQTQTQTADADVKINDDTLLGLIQRRQCATDLRLALSSRCVLCYVYGMSGVIFYRVGSIWHLDVTFFRPYEILEWLLVAEAFETFSRRRALNTGALSKQPAWGLFDGRANHSRCDSDL